MTPDPSLNSTTPRPYRAGPHWAAVLAAVFTWPLLLVGGSVTVYRVGMAVPDWPTTFGVNMFLYNFLDSPWGVHLEHSHRLYGSVVGVACLVLAFWATLAELRPRDGLLMIAAVVAAGAGAIAVFDNAPDMGSVFLVGLPAMGVVSLGLALGLGLVRRRAVLGLTWLALAAVIGQGVLGGYRVRLNSTDLAMIHGFAAQVFFGLMVAICVLTGRRWSAPPRKFGDTSRLRLHATLALGLIMAQIALGAWLRHDHGTAGLASHAGFAALVIPYAVVVSWLALRRRSEVPELAPAAWVMLASVVAQLALGVLAWYILRPFDGIARPVWPAQAAIRIAHQGAGALLLGAAVVLALRAYRHLGNAPRPEAPDTPGTASAPRNLETVA